MDFALQPRARAFCIAGLLLLALVPRAIMAWKLDTLCPDATVYVQQAQTIAGGTYNSSTMDVHRWLYPSLLALLHRLGWTWETAGEVWGVLIATLVVLPLFDWIRRWACDGLAIVASALYAVHPEFIEWSPELIRDATFWFFWTVAICFGFRSKTSTTCIVIACTSSLLAAMFRVEGIFLIGGFVCWHFAIHRQIRPVTIFAVATGLLFLIICTFFGTFSREGPGGLLVLWWQSWFETSASQPNIGTRLWQFADAILSGLHPLYVVLFVVGVWHCRGTRGTLRYSLPLLGSGGLVATGIWIHLWYAGAIEPRYALSLLLLSLPWMAKGMEVTARLVSKNESQQAFATVALLVLIGCVGWLDALTTKYDSRQGRAALGIWLKNEYGPRLRLAGHRDLQRLVGFYSQSWERTLPRQMDSPRLEKKLKGISVVLISSRGSSSGQAAKMRDQALHLGYQEVTLPERVTSLYPGVRMMCRPPILQRGP